MKKTLTIHDLNNLRKEIEAWVKKEDLHSSLYSIYMCGWRYKNGKAMLIFFY